MIFPVPEQLKNFGYEGERRALALLCLGFYATVFAMFGLAALDAFPEWAPCFLALGGCYALGFFALGAGWFWGRWFALGLGSSGVTTALLAVVTSRQFPPALVLFGVMHGLVVVALLGARVAALNDGQEGWRKRWGLDDKGVARVRRSVTRAATSLPSLIMFALAPRQDQEWLATTAAALGLSGLWGLLRGRTWGVLALGAGGVSALLAALSVRPDGLAVLANGYARPFADAFWPTASTLAPFAVFGGALLLAAAAPFVRPSLAYLRRR